MIMRYNKCILMASLVMVFLISNVSAFSVSSLIYNDFDDDIDINTEESSTTLIKVAVYNSPIFKSPKLINKALDDYNWSVNETTYRFKAIFISDKEILGIGKNSLNNENFDLLIIGAESRQFLINERLLLSHDRSYLNLSSRKWTQNIRDFVANGGGYIGICGGANIASQGMPVYPDRASILDILSLRVEHLGIANIYVNNQQWEEWQYAWKIAVGKEGTHLGVPINISVDDSHTIYSDFAEGQRNILWFAGPGMFDANVQDEKLGEVIPLSYYLEEPMDKAPLHMWRLTFKGYKPFYDIQTDIKGQYASIATVYNNSGRVVLFGPHPEYAPFEGGNFNEFRCFFKFGVSDRYVYNWSEVNHLPDDYNWWILQRCTAWVAQLPDKNLPPS